MTLLFRELVLEADDQNRWIAGLMSSGKTTKAHPGIDSDIDSQSETT
jgi:hypothetical protein